MKLYIYFFFFFFYSYSQVGGETVFNFLNVSTSGRQTALGGKILTLLDDVNQPTWNPSVISQELDNKFSVNYVNFLDDVNYGSVNFSRFFNKRFGSLHANITFVDYGKMIRADETGAELGTFGSRDLQLSIGYARNLPWSDMYIGGNIKFITSIIDNYTSTGIAFDIAVLYQNFRKPYRFTLVLRNAGLQVNSFDTVREKMPIEILLGASYDLEELPLRWYLTLDNLQKWNISVLNPSDIQNNISSGRDEEKITFLNNAVRHFIVGAEFFPKGKFNLRMGYNFRRARELRLTETRTFSGISVGFGLKMGRYKLHYAYSKFHPTSNTSTFSLDINLESKIR